MSMSPRSDSPYFQPVRFHTYRKDANASSGVLNTAQNQAHVGGIHEVSSLLPYISA